MKTLVKTGLLLLALATLIPACGGTHSSGGMTPPPADVQAKAQKAVVPVSAVDLATQASNDAIVDSGNPGTTSASKSLLAAPSPSSIAFQSNLSLNVNLAQPRYPGATGQLSVVAAGTVTVSGGNGSVTYAVSVTATTDLTFTDPQSGDIATIASGAVWTYDLHIQWTFTDPNNWAVRGDSTTTLSNLGFTVNHQSEVITGSVSGDRQVTVGYAKTAGVFTSSLTVTATRAVVWNDSTGGHAVTIHMDALDSIVISVDGTAYGPYTRAQIQAIFHLHCE